MRLPSLLFPEGPEGLWATRGISDVAGFQVGWGEMYEAQLVGAGVLCGRGGASRACPSVDDHDIGGGDWDGQAMAVNPS